MSKMVRPKQIYGPGNPIPVGKTKFYEDIVYREGGDKFIRGTNIPRLRLASLGDRTRVGFEDEVNAIAEAVRNGRLRKAISAPLRKKLKNDGGR